MNSSNTLEVKNLVVHFPLKSGIIFDKIIGNVKAVDNVSFQIKKGEIFGLVGESGCGKSTTGKAILGLTTKTSGEVIFRDQTITADNIQSIRSQMQMIFQDPYSSLNPRMNVEDILSEPLVTHSIVEKSRLREKINDLLGMVGLDKDSVQRYPHEFSGGQRQRICIARALAVNPSFIIADEPISALDVSIQAQIIILLKKLQKELNLTILFISHDLSVVKYLCDSVAVMYLGKIVEYSSKKKIFDQPFHPYTKALLGAVPIPNPRKERRRRSEKKTIEGEVPDILNLPIGCSFSTRCDEAKKAKLFEIDCSKLSPSLNQIGIHHEVSCHLTSIKEKNAQNY